MFCTLMLVFPKHLSRPVIIIIIIIIDLITLLKMYVYMLWNLQLSQNVGGISLSKGKEIYSIPYGQRACPRNFPTVWRVCFVLVKLILSIYFRKLSVTSPSAEKTKSYIDILLSFEIFFDLQGQVFILHKSLPQFWDFMGQEKVELIIRFVLFSLSMSTLSGLLKSSVVSDNRIVPAYVHVSWFQHRLWFMYIVGRVSLWSGL